MKTLSQFLFERHIGDVKKDIKFDISINTSDHAEDRKTRHGSDFRNQIDNEEIYEMIRVCSEEIIDALVYNKIEINNSDEGRFVLQDDRTEMNIVGAVHGKITDDRMRINVVTVYRGKNFRNNPQRTYTIRINQDGSRTILSKF